MFHEFVKFCMFCDAASGDDIDYLRKYTMSYFKYFRNLFVNGLVIYKGRNTRAIPPGPPFHGLKIHFFSTNLLLLVMFTLIDIHGKVLWFEDVLCHEHRRKFDRFLTL